MPPIRRLQRHQIWGQNCIFGISSWKGFAAALAGEYGTVSGTVNETTTPFGTGITVGAANGYIRFGWRNEAPLVTAGRTLFVQCYMPDSAGTYTLGSWGANALRNYTELSVKVGTAQSGLQGDLAAAGAVSSATWHSLACTINATTGNLNTIYVDGAPTIAQALGGNGTTTYSDLYLFRLPAGGPQQCPVGTAIQVVLVFDRVLLAAEIDDLHDMVFGA